jgi:hypothetical protein
VTEEPTKPIPHKTRFLLCALAAAPFLPASWVTWRVIEWQARSFERLFTANLFYMFLFGSLFALVVICLVAPPVLWLFRRCRLSTRTQVIVSLVGAALVGAALIHLDPGFPRPHLRAAPCEGVLTGFTCGAVFWLCRTRFLSSRSPSSSTADAQFQSSGTA